jgi:choline dehydrogenase
MVSAAFSWHDEVDASPIAGGTALNFDYIIVGAGSAGCVIANRLSADPSCRVVLIEAGGEPDTSLATIPGAAMYLWGSKLDWGYSTTPQKGLFGRRISYPRGLAVGGTSVLNLMMYVRGNRGDYDRWETMGNSGWGYADVLPYFRRSECNATYADDYHGTDGPLGVTANPHRHPLCERFLHAAQSIGIPYNRDFNGSAQEGCGYFQATLKSGRRCGSKEAFIDPIRDRPNLTLLRNAFVLRLLIERGQARGVEVFLDGQFKRVEADSEVILAAGAIGSPQLLMLSGIGDAAQLSAHNIPVIANLPGVGQDLQDHIGGGAVSAALKEPLDLNGQAADFDAALAEFEDTGSGLLAAHHLDAGAFLRLDASDAEPDFEVIFTPGIAEFYRRDGQLDRSRVYIGGWISRPQSRGSVTLASDNPFEPPLIDPNYFAEPQDLRLTIEGVRRRVDILNAAPFDEVRLGRADPEDIDDAALEQRIRSSASTIWHPTSTCRMGVDERAVVGPDLRVRGVERLRICDASVMPTMVSANTNATAVMIGEKASDLVRAARSP